MFFVLEPKLLETNLHASVWSNVNMQFDTLKLHTLYVLPDAVLVCEGEAEFGSTSTIGKSPSLCLSSRVKRWADILWDYLSKLRRGLALIIDPSLEAAIDAL